MDRNWGPALPDLQLPAAHTAAGPDAAAAAADGRQAARVSVHAGAAHAPGSLDIGALPQQGAPNSGLHPLVLLNRQEFGAAAEEHLQLMLKQLLAAEDVQQQKVRQGCADMTAASASWHAGLEGTYLLYAFGLCTSAFVDRQPCVMKQ